MPPRFDATGSTSATIHPGGGSPLGSSRPFDQSLHLVVLGLVALLVYELWPLAASIVIGGFIALVAHAPFEWLCRKLGGHRTLASSLAILVVLVAVFIPVGFVVYLVVREAVVAIGWVSAKVAAAGGLAQLGQGLPSSLHDLWHSMVRHYSADLAALGAKVAAAAPEIVSGFGRWFAEAVLAIITTYYLFKEGPAFVSFLRRISPLRRAHTEALMVEFAAVAKGLFWGNVMTALLHGLFGAIGYLIVGLPAVLFLGAITMLASFIPGVGTAIIWVPLAIGLWLTGHVWQSLVLLGWGVLIIGGIDQLLRPLLSRGQSKVPDLLMFLTIFGGLLVFGLKGLLLGPLFGGLALTALRLVARPRAIVLAGERAPPSSV